MILNITLLAVLLVFGPSPCFADWVIGPVSKERAKVLGMEIRSKENGPAEICVELEIKTEGELRNFGRGHREHVEMQMRDGERCLVSAPLNEDRSKPGLVIVSFTADRVHLDMITLRVWISQGLGGVIHELRVKDFVEPGTLEKAKNADAEQAKADARTAEVEAKAKREAKALAEQQSEAQAAPERQPITYQEILAGRPAPELTRLAEWAAPSAKGTNATESFWDILKLRETGDKGAIPVLEKIFLENLGTTRIHEFAAAQALFCIDPTGTSDLLSRHLLTDRYPAGLAFKYTAHWEMREPQRSRFIERYLLQSVSTNLLLELTAQVATNLGRVDFVLTLRNSSEGALQVQDPAQYVGKHLFLRNAQGRFARSGETFYYKPLRPTWIELGRGEVHRIQIRAFVKWAADTTVARHLVSPGAAVVLMTDDCLFDIGQPGPFEVVAMFEGHGTGKDQWSGRTVSRPVVVNLSEPAGPVEREPLPLEEAKAVAAKFENLRLGMSPDQVQHTLGLETVAGRMLRYEGIVHYEGSSEPRHVRVCVLRDGYAFTLIYLSSATNGLALSEWLWRPDLDWPKGVTNLIQSLASLGNPQAGTQTLLLHGFAVEVNPGSFMPVAATVFINADKFDEASERKEEIVKCIRNRLAGLTNQDLSLAGRATAIQLDIRSALNSMMPWHPIRYVSLWFDVK